MARKPMFGPDGKPMFGATGKPLLCEPETPCCDPPAPCITCVDSGGCVTTTADCSVATSGTARAQHIIDLPQVSHTGSGRFTHAGGEFLVEGGLTPGGNFLYQSNLGGAPCCTFYGAVVGTECGVDVVPFLTFGGGWSGVGAGNSTMCVGYMKDEDPGPFGNNILYSWFRPAGTPFALDCCNLDESWSYAGQTQTIGVTNCSGTGGQTLTRHAHTIRVVSVV